MGMLNKLVNRVSGVATLAGLGLGIYAVATIATGGLTLPLGLLALGASVVFGLGAYGNYKTKQNEVAENDPDKKKHKKSDVDGNVKPSIFKRFTRGLTILGSLATAAAVIAAPFTAGASLAALPATLGITSIGVLGYAGANAVQKTDSVKSTGFSFGQFFTGLLKGIAIVAGIVAVGAAIASIPLTLGASAPAVLAPLATAAAPIASAIASAIPFGIGATIGTAGAAMATAGAGLLAAIGIGSAAHKVQKSMMVKRAESEATESPNQPEKIDDSKASRVEQDSVYAVRERPPQQTAHRQENANEIDSIDRQQNRSSQDMKTVASQSHSSSQSTTPKSTPTNTIRNK